MKRNRSWISALLLCTPWLLASPARADTSSQSASADAQTSRFGLNLGMGVMLASGNRGQLWQPAEPTYDLTMLYWVTPHLAFGLEGSQATDAYGSSSVGPGRINVGISHIELNARVYASLRQIAPAIGFVSPFLAVGGGAYLESPNSAGGGLVGPQDLEPGMSVGAGLKFTVILQSVAFELLGRWDSVTFKDTYSQQYQAYGFSDLSGQLFSLNGCLSVLF